jgi:hypothetical protein
LNPPDLVWVPIVFRATEVFAAATETLAHVPRRGLMRLMARYASLLIFRHWTAPPPALAHRQAGPEWRQRGSSETPRPRLGCRGVSPSIRRRAGHQTLPDLAASAYEPRRRSDLARAHRPSRCAVIIVGHHSVMPGPGRRDLEERGQVSDRLATRDAPLEDLEYPERHGVSVAPSPHVKGPGPSVS